MIFSLCKIIRSKIILKKLCESIEIFQGDCIY